MAVPHVLGGVGGGGGIWHNMWTPDGLAPVVCDSGERPKEVKFRKCDERYFVIFSNAIFASHQNVDKMLDFPHIFL